LLAEFYETVILPPAVGDELEAGRMSGVHLPDVRALPWVRIQAPSGSPAALKLTFTGTLGILLRAKVEGRIPQIRPLLGHLTRLGFRLSANTLTAIMKHAGE